MLSKLSFKSIAKRSLALVLALMLIPVLFGTRSYADTAGEFLSGENVGASMVLSTDAYNNAATNGLGVKLKPNEEIESSDLVMVALTSSLNVRSEGNADAEIVGKIYRDCGGIVLEKGETWSLIESGDLIGWCNNKYLLFGQEAIDLAKDVGTMTATVTTGCTPIYSSDADDKTIIGYASEKALFEVIYEDGEDWVCVAYDEFDGFIKTEFVDVEFIIDHGETIEAIRERRRKEAEEKKKLIRRNEAIAADNDTLKVLATIIWCESRGESYEGQLAVGSVVMNRVRSGAYPNTVYDVVFASGQFSPVKTGSFQRAYENGSANDSSYKAAQEVLDGYTNVGDMTHFRRKGNRDGYIIGNHVFY
ncbi:MAG: cell wall hydrolase [Lachnospiraceae bacterium]|nr:cell wall hydrolase [Lachnospiraceae bacterium]